MTIFRAPWRDRSESALRAALLLPLVPVARVYAGCAAFHRWLYARGLLRRAHLASRVVSIGSPIAGGTGKTPTAAWLASELHRRGHKVALLSRGHRGRRNERVVVVSDGRHVRARAETAGDEAWVLAGHASGVPVLVGRDRSVAGLRALSAFGADIVVLDDGFQHHRLARDVEIVTFDGEFGFGNGRPLPRGPLREGLAALRGAHAVGVVDGPLAPDDAARVAERCPGAYRFEARRVPTRVRPLRGGAGEPASVLSGAHLGALSGIARPATFRRTLEELGAEVVAERSFRDHHRYRPGDLRGLADEAPLWVTTEKDAVKLRPHWAGDADVRVLAIELEVDEPRRLLDWLEARLR